jgi:gas vesicle protein
MTDQYGTTTEGAGGFLAGALSGLAVGLGLGLLLAPKSGAELRRDISQSAEDLKRAANESYQQVSGKVRDSYQQVSGTVRDTVERGREALNKGQQTWDQAREPATSSTPSFGSDPGSGYTG